MTVMYAVLVMWVGIFIFSSYYAILEGYETAIFATGLSLFMIFVLLLAAKTI